MVEEVKTKADEYIGDRKRHHFIKINSLMNLVYGGSNAILTICKTLSQLLGHSIA